jgi:hypothetical protein
MKGKMMQKFLILLTALLGALVADRPAQANGWRDNEIRIRGRQTIRYRVRRRLDMPDFDDARYDSPFRRGYGFERDWGSFNYERYWGGIGYEPRWRIRYEPRWRVSYEPRWSIGYVPRWSVNYGARWNRGWAEEYGEPFLLFAPQTFCPPGSVIQSAPSSPAPGRNDVAPPPSAFVPRTGVD